MKAYKLLIPIVLQLAIISVMITDSMLPLLTGKEINLKVIPVDPRDLFRGNYVRLRYDFNRLKIKQINNDFEENEKFYFGDQLYLTLEKNDKFYSASGIYKNNPTGLYLKVIVSNRYRHTNKSKHLYLFIKSGLESYYTSVVKAKSLEKDVLNSKINVIARVMVTTNGESRIKELVSENTN